MNGRASDARGVWRARAVAKLRMIAVGFVIFSVTACRGGEPASQVEQTGPTDVGTGTVCRIRTRNGIELNTWIGLPDPIPVGGVAVVLWRSPYRVSGSWGSSAQFAQFLNARGYGFALQDVRGRPDSSGSFDVLRHEIADGQDTTRWIVQQPWSNGRVATIGGSYDGFTALAAAVDNPDVKLVISDDGTSDERCERIGGTYSAHTLSWLHLVETGEWLSSKEESALTNALDPASLDMPLLGHREPYWREALAQDGTALWPVDGSLEPHWEKLCVPAIHVYSQTSGWNDPIDIWRGMREQGCSERKNDQFLIVTPDPHTHHLSLLGTSSTPVNELMLRALDAYLGEKPVDLAAVPRVQWIQRGESRLRSLDRWPAGNREKTWYLAAGPSALEGLLSEAPLGEPFVELTVDPATMDPCDEATYPKLWYTSAPLRETTTVAGAGRVELSLEADVPDTDIVVTLYDWDERRTGEPCVYAGFGAVRARWRDGSVSKPLEPGSVVRASIALTAIAHEFRAGSSLALSIAPGRCGLLENPQTGEPISAQTHRRAGTLRIWHDAAHPTRLVVRVLE